MCVGKKSCSCGCKAGEAMKPRATKVKPGARGKAVPYPAPEPTAGKKAAPAARKGRRGK